MWVSVCFSFNLRKYQYRLMFLLALIFDYLWPFDYFQKNPKFNSTFLFFLPLQHIFCTIFRSLLFSNHLRTLTTDFKAHFSIKSIKNFLDANLNYTQIKIKSINGNVFKRIFNPFVKESKLLFLLIHHEMPRKRNQMHRKQNQMHMKIARNWNMIIVHKHWFANKIIFFSNNTVLPIFNEIHLKYFFKKTPLKLATQSVNNSRKNSVPTIEYSENWLVCCARYVVVHSTDHCLIIPATVWFGTFYHIVHLFGRSFVLYVCFPWNLILFTSHSTRLECFYERKCGSTEERKRNSTYTAAKWRGK